MKFRTDIKPVPGGPKIDHSATVVLFGSCFSEHMQEKFEHYQFKSCANPFGILFNPVSIAAAVKNCADKRFYAPEDMIDHKGRWISLDHHSQFDQRDRQTALDRINTNIDIAHRELVNATHVVITLGTSWVYKWKENGHVVGNCHKIPQKNFEKVLLPFNEITASLQQILSAVRDVNEEANIIFTVSPVRHLKDGFVENSLSKAMLLHAIHEVEKKHRNMHYFPSFEIVMDDLRDYRFYKGDLVHPNEMAVDYIWEIFTKTWISETSWKVMKSIEDIQRSLAHRPFDPESVEHKAFLKKLVLDIEDLKAQYPHIEFQKKRK